MDNVKFASTVKFAYLRDEKNPHRVLTIARTVHGDDILFQVAINRCVNEETYLRSQGYDVEYSKPVDKFDKQMAKKISVGRLNAKPIILKRVEDEAPHITILRHLSKAGNSIERRLCKSYLSKPDPRVQGTRAMGHALAV